MASSNTNRKKKTKKALKQIIEVHPEYTRFSSGEWLDSSAISLILPIYSVRMIRYYAPQNRMPFKMVKVRHTWYAKKADVELYIASLHDQTERDTSSIN